MNERSITVTLRNGARCRMTDDDWVVRPVRGQDARKEYRCPGCDQMIPVGQPHVVVWPSSETFAGSGETGGLDNRRHWHTPCWRARHRGPAARRRRPHPR